MVALAENEQPPRTSGKVRADPRLMLDVAHGGMLLSTGQQAAQAQRSRFAGVRSQKRTEHLTEANSIRKLKCEKAGG